MLLGKEINILSENQFFKFLEDYLNKQGYNLENVKSNDQIEDFYEVVLPSVVADYFSNLEETEKFDLLTIRQGVHFKNYWIDVLKSMLTQDGKITYIR